MTCPHAHLLDRLQFADSYTRGNALVELVRAAHAGWPELLGEEWSCCDYFPPAMRDVLRMLNVSPEMRGRCMNDKERDFLAALPDRLTVWRGCYAGNKAGFSWTTERKVAERFPFLLRYRRTNDGPPLLLQGEVARADVLFVKLDRKEHEVVALPKHVRVVGESVIEGDPMQVRA